MGDAILKISERLAEFLLFFLISFFLIYAIYSFFYWWWENIPFFFKTSPERVAIFLALIIGVVSIIDRGKAVFVLIYIIIRSLVIIIIGFFISIFLYFFLDKKPFVEAFKSLPLLALIIFIMLLPKMNKD